MNTICTPGALEKGSLISAQNTGESTDLPAVLPPDFVIGGFPSRMVCVNFIEAQLTAHVYSGSLPLNSEVGWVRI